jgi:hypothetical protein
MKIKLVLIFALVISFMACENQENSFPDFGSTSVYFPFQRPIRTLIQGKYDLGFNDNDNNNRFEMGVTMTGVYQNSQDRKVHFELDTDLIDATSLGLDTVNVKVLPASYYTIEQESPLTIPSGSIKGRIPVQLEDEFFDDPLAFAEEGEVHYVIPLKITAIEGLDSLLTGVPLEDKINPARIVADDWQIAPKDYTLYGIKFINKYSGVHLRRGEDIITGVKDSLNVASGNTGDTENINDIVVFRADNVVENEISNITTSGKSQVSMTNRIKRGALPSDTDLSINMQISDNGDIIVSPVEGGNQTVTGTGKWVEDGDEWGGQKRNVIYLDYQYDDVTTFEYKSRGRTTDILTFNLKHQVKDTLVMRNRNVKFEQFSLKFDKSGN